MSGFINIIATFGANHQQAIALYVVLSLMVSSYTVGYDAAKYRCSITNLIVMFLFAFILWPLGAIFWLWQVISTPRAH